MILKRLQKIRIRCGSPYIDGDDFFPFSRKTDVDCSPYVSEDDSATLFRHKYSTK